MTWQSDKWQTGRAFIIVFYFFSLLINIGIIGQHSLFSSFPIGHGFLKCENTHLILNAQGFGWNKNTPASERLRLTEWTGLTTDMPLILQVTSQHSARCSCPVMQIGSRDSSDKDLKRPILCKRFRLTHWRFGSIVICALLRMPALVVKLAGGGQWQLHLLSKKALKNKYFRCKFCCLSLSINLLHEFNFPA